MMIRIVSIKSLDNLVCPAKTAEAEEPPASAIYIPLVYFRS
jgi:hypothetical protein